MKMTLEQAKKQIGKPLNIYGDTLTEYDTESLENLRVFIGSYLASPFNDPTIKDDAVIFDLYQ